MKATVVIDALPERVLQYRGTHAIVAVDVIRATTTILTALNGGRRVYPVATIAEAMTVAATLPDALLAGELAGVKPDGFEANNSPAAIASRTDRRPLVLLSSTGTRLLANARGGVATYVACLRNMSATAREVARHHRRVALIGAGSQGEPRAEDQMACAWIALRLIAEGSEPEDVQTAAEIARWHGASIELIREGPSADYLRRSEQEDDLAFILEHVDDLDWAGVLDGREVSLVSRSREPQEATSTGPPLRD